MAAALPDLLRCPRNQRTISVQRVRFNLRYTISRLEVSFFLFLGPTF